MGWANHLKIALLASITATTLSLPAAEIIDLSTPNRLQAGSVTGKLAAIDVPYLSLGGTGRISTDYSLVWAGGKPGFGPSFPADDPYSFPTVSQADQGFQFVGGTNAIDIERHQTGSWEPDGTLASERPIYRIPVNGGGRLSANYLFNNASLSLGGLPGGLPDGAVINAVYATWGTRGSSGAEYAFSEGANTGGTAFIGHNSAPQADLTLRWFDNLNVGRDVNFQRLISSPITVADGDGFRLQVFEYGNTHQTDTVIIDFSLPVPMLYWDPINGTGLGTGSAVPVGTWNTSTANWNTTDDGTGGLTTWGASSRPVFSAGADATGAYSVTLDGTHDIDGAVFEEGKVTLSGTGGIRLTSNAAIDVAAGATATITSVISEDSTHNLNKTGDGMLTLSGDNTFTGPVGIGEGTLSVPTLANANTASPLGAFPTAGAGGIELTGGTLQYTGATTTTDRGFTSSGTSTISLTGANVDLTIGASSGSGIIRLSGGSGSSITIPSIALVGPTTLEPIGGLTASIGNVTGGSTLTLGGTTTGHEITGTSAANIRVDGVGNSWRLSGASSFGSEMQIRAGSVLIGANYTGGNGPLGRAGSLNIYTSNSNNDVALLLDGPFSTPNKEYRVQTNQSNPDTGSGSVTFGGTTADNSTFNGTLILGHTQNNRNTAGYSKEVLLTAATGGQVTFTGTIKDPDASKQSAAKQALLAAHAASITAITKTGDGTVVLTGDNAYAGSTSVQAGTLQIGNGTTASTIPANVIDVAAGSNLIFSHSDARSHAGGITGAGNFENALSSDLTLLGDNTIAGTITTNGGSLTIGNGGAGASLPNANVQLDGATVLTVNNSDVQTMNGAISGNGSLIKAGTGTVTLSGTLGYTGTTTVNNGTLLLDGIHTGGDLYSIAPGAVFGGSGSTDAALNIAGTLSPGNSPEVVGAGDTTFAGGATFQWEVLDGTQPAPGVNSWDLLEITGDLTIATPANFTLNIVGLMDPVTPGMPTMIWNSGAQTGPFDIITWTGTTNITAADLGSFIMTDNMSAFGFFDLTTTSVAGGPGALQLTFTSTIPEPGTWAMLLVLFTACTWQFRQHRQKKVNAVFAINNKA